MTPREEFLQKMYEEMFREISQQISTVWQALATVFGSFAIVALSERGVFPIDLGVSIVITICTWFLMAINECSYWYNRNLCIISNIERQFLVESDLKNVMYYFGAHRPLNKMILQLKSQVFLGSSIIILVMIYHFSTRIIPGLSAPLDHFEPLRAAPYLALIVFAVALGRTIRGRNAAYEEFVTNSPGIDVNTASVTYGPGHGH